VRLFGRTLVTVALVQEKHDEQEHKDGGEVERRKQSLGTRLLESGFDANLARHVNDGRGWSSGEIHLLPKKDVFYTAKQRAGQNLKHNDDDLNRRTFLNRRDVQGSR